MGDNSLSNTFDNEPGGTPTDKPQPMGDIAAHVDITSPDEWTVIPAGSMDRAVAICEGEGVASPTSVA